MLLIYKSIDNRFKKLAYKDFINKNKQIFQFGSFLKQKKMKNFLTIFATILTLSFLSVNQLYSASYISHTSFFNQQKTYVVNPDLNLEMLFPWFSTNAAMAPCPTGPLVFNLQSGECGAVVDDFGFAFPPFPTTPQSGASSLINNTIINSSVYCASGQTVYRRLFSYAGPTDLEITSVQLGVYQSVNNPVVAINFYNQNNDLIGGFTTSVPNLNRAVYTATVPTGVEIVIPSNSSYYMEVIASAPLISVFKMGYNNSGYASGTSSGTVIADNCPNAFNQEIWSGAPGAIPNAIVMYATGLPKPYKFENILNNYKEGDKFPIGTTPMAFRVTDATGVETSCAFSIVVNEFVNTLGNVMACNDLVQVSLEDNCQTIITPAMVLEGDHYGCFDNYTVEVTTQSGISLGNVVTRANINQKLQVKVTGPDGNSCWGELLIQDKLGPILECTDIYTNCDSDLSPGSVIEELIPIAARILPGQGTLGSSSTGRVDFVIPVGTFKPGTVITDLDVYLDIEHPDVSQLAAQITSPDGITVPLFSSLSCSGKNINASFDDDGDPIACEASVTPAVAGRYEPLDPLSAFNGKPLQGNWVVSIFDLVPGVEGEIKEVHLIFKQNGAVLSFPTSNQVTAQLIDENTYKVKGIDNCVDATLVYKDEVIEEDCQSIYYKVIRRCWSGFDANGNVAEPCCQNIYIYRNSLSTLVFPPNFDGLGNNPAPLSCVDYGNSVPPVSVTGAPEGNFCDNILIIDPVDTRIDICENSYKILRTHKVVEWCSGNILIHNQIIKVVDHEGPEMKCPEDTTISTDDYSCEATYRAVRPEILFDCSSTFTYYLEYGNSLNGTLEFSNEGVDQVTGTINGLPLGTSVIKWTVTDACGNSSECTYEVTVKDEVRPVAVCDQHTIASITGNGKAIVEAITFDDGSTDNCGIAEFLARKMTDKCKFGTTKYTPAVEFCCEEVGTTIMVELLVVDIHGNRNTCMVEVEVQDKLPPYITKCPEDITLDCFTDYTDLKITGEPEYVDNCEVVKVWHKDEVDINMCGVGTVTRTWTVEDRQGYRNSCVQVITLVDRNPFNGEDIIWPENYTTNVCHSTLEPDSLPLKYSKPRFPDDHCSLVAYHYKDQVFKLVDGACEKILRTWTVLDWCTYNEKYPVLGQGWYEYTQIIKIQNDVAPQIVGPSGTVLDGCVDRTFPTYGNCEGDVTFTMDAIDDCPADNKNLAWSFRLYESDGLTLITSGNTNRFSRVLKIGKYVIKWTVEDRCGNRSFCTQNLNVIEAKKPTPYCITSLTTAVMNNNGTIEIWAKDFDHGSFDNCTSQEDLWFTFFNATPVRNKLNEEHYFKGNGILATRAEYEAGIAQKWIPNSKSSGLWFSCKDIPNGISQEVSLDMTVTDKAGNQDYCTVIIVLQDNSGACPDSGTRFVSINGRVEAGGIGLQNSSVHLESSKPELNTIINTNDLGQYSFTGLPENISYTVSMSDNRNILNGVTTLDLVYIQRHILGLATFTDPKLIIASDADNSGRITAADLAAIRKVILGITEGFPNGQQSWRFITSNQTFTNPQAPFPFIESYTYSNLSENKIGQNFQAIKIGDVNASAVINYKNNQVESRSHTPLKLFTQTIKTETGIISVPVYAENFDNILGYQFTMEFDAGRFELMDIQAGLLSVNESNFGMNRLGSGILTTSWNGSEPVNITSGQPLFTLKFRSKDGSVVDVLTVSSKVTKAVAYDADDKARDVVLVNRAEVMPSAFEVKQNIPNPFRDQTVISFTLPETGDVTVTFTDVTGKVLKVISGNYPAGNNQISVTSADFDTKGVILYRVDNGSNSVTRKMIRIE
ncbi:MAG: Hyalin repeat-containing protein [Bacteroidetes bacterium OLB9]|nr:MAG: Hyalin repeat-containing protein [Bacteroidetes bacterium OLB9]